MRRRRDTAGPSTANTRGTMPEHRTMARGGVAPTVHRGDALYDVGAPRRDPTDER